MHTQGLPWGSSRSLMGLHLLSCLYFPRALAFLLPALPGCRDGQGWVGGRQPGSGSGAEVVLFLHVLPTFPWQLNLSRPIEEQGPLDVIIHKLTDVILEADQNDSQSLELVHRFQVSEDSEEGRPQNGPVCF